MDLTKQGMNDGLFLWLKVNIQWIHFLKMYKNNILFSTNYKSFVVIYRGRSKTICHVQSFDLL